MLVLVGALYLCLATSSPLETSYYCRTRLLDVPVDYRDFYLKLCDGEKTANQYSRSQKKYSERQDNRPMWPPHFNIDMRPTLPPWRPTLPKKHAQQLSSQIYDNYASSRQPSFVSHIKGTTYDAKYLVRILQNIAKGQHLNATIPTEKLDSKNLEYNVGLILAYVKLLNSLGPR